MLPDYYAEPGLAGQHQYPQDLPQEFIDPFGGKLHFSFIDLRLPGNSGLDIVIRRNYTSLDDAAGIPTYPSYLGLGWSSVHFGRVLKQKDTNVCTGDSGSQGASANPILELADGSRQVLYVVDSASPPEYKGYLFVTKDRWVAQCKTTFPTGLIVKSPEGIQYTLDQFATEGGASVWYATEIRDRNDQTLKISYATPDGGSPRVTEIKDPLDGRMVQFVYAGTKGTYDYRLAQITAHGRTWSYTYTKASKASKRQFLTGVNPPAGNGWKFAYNDEQPGGTSKGALSLNKITYPYGGTINYSYELVQFDPANGNSLKSTVVSKKVSSGSDGSAGTWNYRYQPGPTVDTTTITGPSRTDVYKHFGYQATPPLGSATKGVWMIGLLLEKNIDNVQTEVFEWGSQVLSGRSDGNRPMRLKSDPDTYAPILKKKSIQRDGTTYATTYTNFDNYGHARAIDEQGNASRHTDLTYAINTNRWILNLISRETLLGEGSIERKFDTNRGRLDQEAQYGVTTDYTYHSSGAINTVKDANGHTTTYTDYYRGIARDERRPEAVSITRAVDDFGNVTAYTDGRNNRTGFSWDGLNRLKGIDFPSGHTDITLSWNDASRTKTLSRGGLSEVVTMDGFGRETQVSRTGATPEITVTTRYNALGEKTFESYPSVSLGTNYAYDDLGRMTKRTHSDGTSRSTVYSSGNTVKITNERNLVTTHQYRAYGDPDDSALMAITDPEGVTSLKRTPLGAIEEVTQNDKTRQYGYNSQKFLTSVTDAETGVTSFGRDNVGNMTSRKIGNSGTTLFSYDDLNRLETINYPGTITEDASFSYDKNSNLILASNGVTTWKGDYNARNQPVWEELTVDGQSFRVSLDYSELDALSSITYPKGQTVSYSPDVLGRPTTASPYLSRVEYHPNGYAKHLTYSNGFNTDFSLTNRQWLDILDIKDKNAKGQLSLDYNYDAAANVTRLSRSLDNYDLTDLKYDGRDRLTEVFRTVNGVGETDKLSYDDDGDINSYALGSQALAYRYDSSNRLDQITQNGQSLYQFSYDSYGNTTKDGPHTYLFDDAGQLRKIDNGAEQYTYDAHGHWAKRVVGTTTTYFFYTRTGQLMGEYAAAPGTGWREPVYLDGTQIAALENAVLINPTIAIDVATGKALEAVTDERLTHDKLTHKNKNSLLAGLAATTNLLDQKSKTLEQTEEPLFYDGFATADLSAWNWVVAGQPGKNRLEVKQQAALGDADSGDCQADSGGHCGLAIVLEGAAQAGGEAVTVGLLAYSVLMDEPVLQGRFWLDPGLLALSEVPGENELLIAEFSRASDPVASQHKLRFYLQRRDWEGYWLRLEHWDEAQQSLVETGSGYLAPDLGKPAPEWLEFEWRAGPQGLIGVYRLDKTGTRLMPSIVEQNGLNLTGQTLDQVRFGAMAPPPHAQGVLYFDELELGRGMQP